MGEQKSLAEFFKNGQIKYSGNYRNGKKFGTWTWYFENGNKRVLGNYNFLGKQDGIWTWYFENGQKETSQDFGSGF
jgi:antitoxin component YwqK of YwqJK toxin-antitoxin module